MRVCVFLLSALCWSALSPQPSTAQSAPNKVATRYRDLVAEAIQEFGRGNWPEAHAAFERAHALNPSARTLRGMGMTAFEAHRYVDAIRYLDAAASDERRPLTSEQREEAGKVSERARRYVAHIQLKLDPQPASAHVKVNGQPHEHDASLALVADPGVVEVEVVVAGYEPVMRRMALNAGAHEEIVAQLRPVRPAQVAVEQQVTTQAEPTTPSAELAEESSATNALAVETQREPRTRTSAVGVLKWVAGGGAIAALATGAVLLAVQKSQAAQFDAKCRGFAQLPPDCTRLRRDIEGPLWTGPIVAFAAGGALAALTAVLFVVDAGQPDSATALAPRCGAGPGELGVQCSMRF